MTKKYNKGSKNQNTPEAGGEFQSGDNSKGNKRNQKMQQNKANQQ